MGFVVESLAPEVAAEYVSGWLLAGRAGERAHPHYPFGQYSDDTQLARELLLTFDEAGGWDPTLYGARVAEVFRSARDIGAGNGTRSAALRLLQGVPWREAGTPAPYAGNGSAMRAGPLGILFQDDPPSLRRVAREQSRVTHQDPRCAAGALAVAGAVALGTRTSPLNHGEFIAQLVEWVEPEDASFADALRGLVHWSALEPAAAARQVHGASLDPAYTSRWQGISAFVVPSVLWSLYAFLRTPDDYWMAVCTAIGVGGDTDTMAAMTGAIAGARCGARALPGNLLDRLNDQGSWRAADLAALAGRCSRPMRTMGLC